MSRRILFVLRHAGYVRNFEGVLEELAGAGHHVHLAFEFPREAGTDLIESLAARHPGITWGTAPVREDRWRHVAHDLRAGITAVRYRGRLYDDSPKLRARGLREAPQTVLTLTKPEALRHPLALWALDRALRRLDLALPPDPGVERFLDAQRPDVLVVTPLVADPTQDDVVRAARARGIPAALAVYSWDNLTNKGPIRPSLDRVFVWNEAQRREAIDLHGVPAQTVVMTGAHPWDHWFAWGPAEERAAFCERVGLPADRPIVLYLCSSKFIAPREPAFVRRWLRELRAGPARLRDAAVLVRPHPASGVLWEGMDLSDLGPVSIWPPTGADPRDDASRAGYFDSMFHAAAAVGVNTTALIELAIVGRPALTVLAPEFAATQGGTLHFAHLTETAGGILTLGRDFPEHLAQLDAAMGDGRPGRPEAFLREFVRPLGLDRPAAPVLAAAIAGLPAPARAPRSHRVADPLLRVALTPALRRSGREPRPGRRRLSLPTRKERNRARKQAQRRWRRTRRAVGAALGRG